MAYCTERAPFSTAGPLPSSRSIRTLRHAVRAGQEKLVGCEYSSASCRLMASLVSMISPAPSASKASLEGDLLAQGRFLRSNLTRMRPGDSLACSSPCRGANVSGAGRSHDRLPRSALTRHLVAPGACRTMPAVWPVHRGRQPWGRRLATFAPEREESGQFSSRAGHLEGGRANRFNTSATDPRRAFFQIPTARVPV